MGILNNDTVIVDAILTKLGRDKLRQGEPLGITQYAFGDTGVDYNLYNPNHPSGSDAYGQAITALPQLEEGFNWNDVPVICGSHEAIMQKMERLNMNLLHASFGKTGANPDGDVVFMVLYYANSQGTSTAAVLTMPNDPTACLLFVTFDVTLAPEKKQNF